MPAIDKKITVLSIGSDTKLFEEGSAVRTRVAEYGTLFKELHIVVFTLRRTGFSPQQISPNVRIYPTSSRSKILFVNDALILSGKIIRENGLERESVVTVQDPFESGLVGAALKFWHHIPLHVQIHTDFFDPHFGRESILNAVRSRIAPFVLKRADAVRAVSKSLSGKIRGRYAVPAEKITVLPIRVDTEPPQAAHQPLFRETHAGFDSVGLMASRLTGEKRIGTALKALARVTEENPLIGLVIAGEGPERAHLETLARELGLEKNVFFEGWQRDMKGYYASFDFFLLTSAFEGYGMTLVESAAAGVPVISSPVGIAPELVEDGVNSFLCPVDSVEDFAEKILKLGSDPELRKVFGAKIREKARSFGRSREEYLREYGESIASAVW